MSKWGIKAMLTLLTMAFTLSACGTTSQPAASPPTPSNVGAALPGAQQTVNLPSVQQTANLPAEVRTDVPPEIIPPPMSTGPVITLPPPPPSATPRPADWNWPPTWDTTVSNARTALGQAMGIESETIKVVQLQAAYYPTASGGCRVAGDATPSTIDVIRIIVLNATGKQRTYFTNAEGQLITCSGEPDNEQAKLIDYVKGDLAKRLNVNPTDIKVIIAIRVNWSDPGVGCPGPYSGYAQVITQGYFTVLEYNGQQYNYHSGTLCQDGHPAPTPAL